jgi:hypothetical protein
VLGDFDEDFIAAVQQVNVLTSRGIYLTFWGYLLNVKRLGTTETDASYARRIARTVMLPRTTAGAIVKALQGVANNATVTEYGVGTAVDKDYTVGAYNDFQNSFLIKLSYQGDSANSNGLFVGKTYLGQANQGFIAPVISALGTIDSLVREITEETKLAGTRVVYQKQ